ncbi:hypothetical protein FVE85_8089 [Porphyridium purpureum]|uniref:Uncharacterized protein n=1 Tax=Porphyridium purpureum TaxID=35688 RepID=A0A5J4YNP0_PORPP|nr:hypothetical protein FVE85_8089 [Porphyridium purpureum]|eukprot:POR6799..scf295_9
MRRSWCSDKCAARWHGSSDVVRRGRTFLWRMNATPDGDRKQVDNAGPSAGPAERSTPNKLEVFRNDTDDVEAYRFWQDDKAEEDAQDDEQERSIRSLLKWTAASALLVFAILPLSGRGYAFGALVMAVTAAGAGFVIAKSSVESQIKLADSKGTMLRSSRVDEDEDIVLDTRRQRRLKGSATLDSEFREPDWEPRRTRPSESPFGSSRDEWL